MTQTQTQYVADRMNDWGAIKVDANQMTNLPGVFAGGDVVRGPSLVVHAVRDGRRQRWASISISRRRPLRKQT